MFLPVLNVEDGYGWTYGARFGLSNPVGARSRVTFPLTWGADKRAAVQLERLERGPSTGSVPACRFRGASTRSTSATTSGSASR